MGHARTNKENPVGLPTTKSKRKHTLSERLKEATNNANEAQAKRVVEKQKRDLRAQEKKRQAVLNLTVEQDGDSEEVRRLKGTHLFLDLHSYSFI